MSKYLVKHCRIISDNIYIFNSYFRYINHCT